MNNTAIKQCQVTPVSFLPNFCDVATVLLVIILTELLAFIFVLAPLNPLNPAFSILKKNFLTDLAMTSLFMLWIALLSMGILCALRRWLVQLRRPFGLGLISYLVILLTTLIVSEFAWQINEYSLTLEAQANFEITPPHLIFLLRNLGMSAMIGLIVLRYFYIQFLWKQETEARACAQLQALQARIRPHFLFNTMNMIASLIRSQPQKAELAMEDFAELFRANLSDVKKWVKLGEELQLCQHYLRIETLRLGERLQVLWQINSLPKDALLPPLCLQPLLENAVYHGIQPALAGGTIQITGQFDGHMIQLTVENPLAELASDIHQGHCMAQHNIYQRLQMYYGHQARLQIACDAQIYRTILYFPYRNQIDENSHCR